MLNRALPEGVKTAMLGRLFGREPDGVFPAHYDRCWHDALIKALAEAGWEEDDVVPVFVGARYFAFSRSLLAAYLAYEELAARSSRGCNLAPYYLIDARAALDGSRP